MILNVGSIFCNAWLVSLPTSRVTDEPAGEGFIHAYTIAAAAMTLALVIFIAGNPRHSAESKAAATHTPMISVIRNHLVQSATPAASRRICQW